MTESRKTSGLTPSQTVGPYFAYALTPSRYGRSEFATGDLRVPDLSGEPVVVEGRVLDADGAPIPDAMLEFWQPDAEGRFASPLDPRGRSNSAFKGFGRVETVEAGKFTLSTIKPGRVPGPNGALQAPHITLGVFARGMLNRLHTRIYFPDEPANAEDPILALVPEDRRHTLIARAIPGEAGRYRFDVHVQGADETVFFDA